jgi:large subunit ribosomal protein L28|tara:strand:- start:1086 stop:1412 length:327 start_codon:yes stop_codon:yes gene_type:complete
MSKQCELTGLKVLFGNSVSHAHNKTKRTFTPNIQKKSTYSECLDRMIRLNLSIKAIRSMDTAGGFDKYILSIPNNKLSSKALQIKKAIKKKINIKDDKTKKVSLKKKN